MEYTEEQIRTTLSENNRQLPQNFTNNLEKAIQNGECVSMPVLEDEEGIRMMHLTDFQYHYLSKEVEKYVKHRKYINSPEFKAKWKKENDEFWRRFAIRARIIALREYQNKTNDWRTKLLSNVEEEGKQDYIERMQQEGREFNSADMEIAGAEAVFGYIESNHPDLYGYVQTCMKWWDE